MILREDVDQAAVRIGQRVTVLCGDDETADERFHGQRGVVVGFFADDVELVRVEVEGLGEEWFFVNELIIEPMRLRRTPRAAAQEQLSAFS
ncbi:MAG: hypothetical protein GQE15_13990 [Archangiaceae bacterium]|nr:hypothetical protein [Archangiaceae bacterium]